MDAPGEDDGETLSIDSCFIRGRNALYAKADLGPLYMARYLHLQENRLQVDPEHDALFKRALAAFVLHCVSRPRRETLAWTLNFQEPLLNVFLVGDTGEGSVAGRVYSENVKRAEENALYQESARGPHPLHRSVVAFEGADPVGAAEEYYRRSEQRPARYFQTGPEEFAIVSAHPDYDEVWFRQLEAEAVERMEELEDARRLEKRVIRWHCGCDQLKILRTLEPVWQRDPEGLFLEEEMIEVNCPRCAGRYRITREMMEAFVSRE